MQYHQSSFDPWAACIRSLPHYGASWGCRLFVGSLAGLWCRSRGGRNWEFGRMITLIRRLLLDHIRYEVVQTEYQSWERSHPFLGIFWCNSNHGWSIRWNLAWIYEDWKLLRCQTSQHTARWDTAIPAIFATGSHTAARLNADHFDCFSCLSRVHRVI